MTFARERWSRQSIQWAVARGQRLALALMIAAWSLVVGGGLARADTTTVDIGPTSNAADLGDKLPTSGPFLLQYSFAGEVVDASVDIWPARIKDCAAGPPARGSRQSYHLPFTLTTTDGKSVGKTTVPHLQVAQTFCFAISSIEKAAPDASTLENTLKQHTQAVTTFDDAFKLAQELTTTVTSGFCELGIKPTPGKSVCERLDVAALEGPLLQAVLPAVTAQADANAKAKEYDQADAALTDAKKAVAQLTPPAALKTKVPSKEWVEAGVTQTRIGDAAKEVQAAGNKLDAETSKKMLEFLRQLQEALQRAEESLAKKQAAAETASTLQKAALNAERDIALAFFKSNLRRLTTQTLSVTADTNDFNNYVSPEIGIALVKPFVKNGDTALLPYTAVNIYFQPVDRELSLDKLVNPFWQRFSLSVGISLSQDLHVPKAELSPVVLGAFGVVGAGYRVLPFARVAALVFLAKETPSGGLSSESKLISSGALAVSGDVDFITFIGNSLQK